MDIEMSHVLDTLEEPKTSRTIAEELGFSLDVVRKCLTELQALGKVCRNGNNYQQVREELPAPKKPPLAVVEVREIDVNPAENLAENN